MSVIAIFHLPIIVAGGCPFDLRRPEVTEFTTLEGKTIPNITISVEAVPRGNNNNIEAAISAFYKYLHLTKDGDRNRVVT